MRAQSKSTRIDMHTFQVSHCHPTPSLASQTVSASRLPWGSGSRPSNV